MSENYSIINAKNINLKTYNFGGSFIQANYTKILLKNI